MQLLVVRNALACTLCALVTNGCYYAGNIFSLKASTEQSPSEVLMATLIWTALSYCGSMLIAHLPSLMSQRFLENPDHRPGVWFCLKKLAKGSSPYFVATIGGMVCVGLLTQHTPQLRYYKLHFYLGDLCDLTFTAGITLVVRRIYYKETCEGRSRSLTLKDSLKLNTATTDSQPRTSSLWHGHLTRRPKISATPSSPQLHEVPKYRATSFWREYMTKLPNAVLVALAGGYVHVVSSYRLMDRGEFVIVLFAVSSVLVKLVLQEFAKWHIFRKRVRSIHTMCVLVGVPTVLIDTQARIVLLGTQTTKFLGSGILGMGLAEICMRVTKAAMVMRTIRRRTTLVDERLQMLAEASTKSLPASPSSLKLEFELWRKQIHSYHTAELTTDMYADYISIGCSQSITFWFVGHPLYPALRLEDVRTLSGVSITTWRMNQMLILGFQFVVEVVVDYICVVLEMAIGIECDRIKGVGAFLGALFMTMAVLTINISATIYLG